MNQDGMDSFVAFTCLAGLFGIVFGMILIAYEDGVPLGRLKKILCRLNFHKFHFKTGKVKSHKYYCTFCKKPRKHPDLKVIDGGNKMGNNKYNF
jgi:hypothetical protein